MKNLFLLGMMLVCGVSSWAGTAPAGTDIYTTDGYKATVLDDGTVAITWIYNEGEVTIPAEVTDKAEESTGTYKVSALGNGSGVAGDNITRLVLSEGITTIGASAFWGKTSLTSLSLPSTLTTIGGWAFTNCTGLTSIHSAAATAPELGDDVFKTDVADMDWDYIGQHCALYVPAGSATIYKGSATWTYWDSFWYVLEPGTVTIGEDGFATYYNWYGYNLPEGMTAYAVTGVENSTVKLAVAYQTCAEVAKSTGVVLKGEANKTYTFELLPFATAEAPEDNLLKGVHEQGTVSAEDGDYNFYKLAKGDSGLGFYWGATDGGVFELAANEAYLPLQKSESGETKFLSISNTTGIATIKTTDVNTNDEIYSIAGMKQKKDKFSLPKGLYIINGKKTIIK